MPKEAGRERRGWVLSRGFLGCLAVVGLLSACVSNRGALTAESVADEPVPLVGVSSPEEVLAHVPDWVEEMVLAEPDAEAAESLTTLAVDFDLTVFFGTWCSDSRRELARLWRGLELTGSLAGQPAGGTERLPIRYIGVDREKREPGELLEGRHILYVPTFIVERDGVELGRIVEGAPNGIEVDLADLLSGDSSGLITMREDLGRGGEDAEP